jgi:hypothetical protein
MPQSVANRPTFVGPHTAQTLDAVRAVTGSASFDPDVWHVMDKRDNELIEQEILHGAGSSKFVYSFKIQNQTVSGISVVGARHLAAHYGGLKHRLVASQQKIGSLFTFTSFPAENMPMSVTCAVVHELADEPDFYGVVVEMTDIKSGNTIQVECRENRYEIAGKGTANERMYERPHYPKIAQSKGYRNALLSLIPQDLRIRWELQQLQLKKDDVITESVIDEKRHNVLHFAAQKGIPLERQAVEQLTLEQIAGLGDAAREGALPAFIQAAHALGLDVGDGEIHEDQQQTRRPSLTDPRPRPKSSDKPAAEEPQQQQQGEQTTKADTIPTAAQPTQAAEQAEQVKQTEQVQRAEQPAAAQQQAQPAAAAAQPRRRTGPALFSE